MSRIPDTMIPFGTLVRVCQFEFYQLVFDILQMVFLKEAGISARILGVLSVHDPIIVLTITPDD